MTPGLDQIQIHCHTDLQKTNVLTIDPGRVEDGGLGRGRENLLKENW